MKGFYRNVGTPQSPLEQRPEIVDPLGMNLPANLLFQVVHGLVYEILGFQLVVSHPAVSIDPCALFDLPQNLIEQSVTADIRNHHGANLASIPIKHPITGIPIFALVASCRASRALDLIRI